MLFNLNPFAKKRINLKIYQKRTAPIGLTASQSKNIRIKNLQFTFLTLTKTCETWANIFHHSRSGNHWINHEQYEKIKN